MSFDTVYTISAVLFFVGAGIVGTQQTPKNLSRPAGKIGAIICTGGVVLAGLHAMSVV